MNIYLLFNSGIVKFVLKTDGGEEGVWEWECRKPYFVIFVFWVDLIIGKWDAVGLDRKFYLEQAEIACFSLFRDVRVSSRFPCATPRMERFSLDLLWAVKKYRKYVLEVGCMGKGRG